MLPSQFYRKCMIGFDQTSKQITARWPRGAVLWLFVIREKVKGCGVIWWREKGPAVREWAQPS